MPEKKTGAIDAAGKGLREATNRVEEMQAAIAQKTYGLLKRIPGLAGPVQLVQDIHEAYTGGVYEAVREGAAGILEIAGLVERFQRETAAGRAPMPLPGPVLGAINGVVGDFLAASNNALAVAFGFYDAGKLLPLTREALTGAIPDPAERVCVFVHGLSGDESGWRFYERTAWNSPGAHYGQRVREEFGFTPLYIRYNSGLALQENAALLAASLEALLAAYPKPITELVLIGHSMGGLVSRLACHAAAEQSNAWLERTSTVVCLGSPHLGAPLAKAGDLAATLLRLFDVTEPLAKIADARSAGIKDLKEGLSGLAHSPKLAGVRFRFVGATLHGQPGHVLGGLFGDGMVQLASSLHPGFQGDFAAVEVNGIGHMQLLNHPRVYEHLKQWLTAPTAL